MTDGSLDLLFDPSSVAIIGASNEAFKSGGMFLRSFVDSRFKGVYPVNQKSSEVMGLKSHGSVVDIPSFPSPERAAKALSVLIRYQERSSQ